MGVVDLTVDNALRKQGYGIWQPEQRALQEQVAGFQVPPLMEHCCSATGLQETGGGAGAS